MLEGRRILVTGASSGIGRAVAELCVAQGARVLATGRRADALDDLDGVRRFACDLLEPGAPEACVAACVEGMDGLDGVVHAAGTVLRGEDPRSTPDEQIDDVLGTNLALPLRVARAALGALGRGGAIVLLSSQLGRIGAPGYASYCAAKGGVDALVRALAVDVGPDGIRVNAVAPGLVRTPMAYFGRDNFDELVPAIAERHPLRRIGEPGDIAGPVAFLLSDAAAWITGQTLVVDGGFTIQ
ncbi:MAG: SDR family oxidoreductase [Actinomycetota bacterium]|nr:SDR family oxidoreductase [Actinomycetota bacterium]